MFDNETSTALFSNNKTHLEYLKEKSLSRVTIVDDALLKTLRFKYINFLNMIIGYLTHQNLRKCRENPNIKYLCTEYNTKIK